MEVNEKSLPVGEYKVNFVSFGNGEPLLFLHGSEPAEDWRVWEPLFPLGDSHRIVAPDLLGHGKSSKPDESPDYKAQAHMVRDLVEKLSLGKVGVVGGGWGGQIGLEFALDWPESVSSLVLIASSYDQGQLRRLQKLRRPTLIVYAEDDMITQLKAGYQLRDAIGTSRLEVMAAVSRDPTYDFRMSHRLQKFRGPQVLQLMRLFLSKPQAMIAEPPELENELKGIATRKAEDGPGGAPST